MAESGGRLKIGRGIVASQSFLSAYLGTLGLGTPVDAGAALFIQTQLSDKQDYLLASGKTSLFGELITVAGFTATAVARQVALYGYIV